MKWENYGQAEAHIQEAITLMDQSENPEDMSILLSLRGELRLRTSKVVEALADFRKALESSPKGHQECMAIAQYGLARVYTALHDYETAWNYGTSSQTTLSHIGHRKANEVKKWLRTLRNMIVKKDGQSE